MLLVVARERLLGSCWCRVHGMTGVAAKAVGAVAAMVMRMMVVTLEVLLHLLLLEVLLVVKGGLFIDLDPVGLGSPVLEPDLGYGTRTEEQNRGEQGSEGKVSVQ